ncbi:MAG: HAD family phosphatase [Lachnospiraceae bacterium]|nr:HAD family phosphatase [Lachnospiraceae bacterium]
MKPIRNIVFDMGQVLMYFRPKVYIERQGIADEEDRALLLREIFQKVEWIQLDRGVLTVDEAVEIITARLPMRLRDHAEAILRGWWKGPLMPVPGMEELMKELKGLGYNLYMLSNANGSLNTYVAWIPGSEYLDGRVVSADWGMLKPEREIFEKLAELYELDLEECVFIDDSPVNVEGSLRAGLHGIVFHDDVMELRKELQRMGVPVRG